MRVRAGRPAAPGVAAAASAAGLHAALAPALLLALVLPLLLPLAGCRQGGGGARDGAGNDTAGGGPAAAGTEQVQRKGDPVELAQLEALLAAGDWSAIDGSRAAGSAALPALAAALQNEDPEVRSLAILCLEQVGGPESARLLVAAFGDPDEQVRGYAADILLAVPDPAVLPQLRAAAAGHEDPRVRSRALLLVGLLGDRSDIEPLRHSRSAVLEPEVALSSEQALARLGDPEARARLLDQLSSPDARERFEALGRLEYVNDPSLVPRIAPLLEDSAAATVLSAVGDRKEVLRVKDAAARTIAELLGQPFSFKLPAYEIRSEAEIRHIQEHLRKQGMITGNR